MPCCQRDTCLPCQRDAARVTLRHCWWRAVWVAGAGGPSCGHTVGRCGVSGSCSSTAWLRHTSTAAPSTHVTSLMGCGSSSGGGGTRSFMPNPTVVGQGPDAQRMFQKLQRAWRLAGGGACERVCRADVTIAAPPVPVRHATQCVTRTWTAFSSCFAPSTSTVATKSTSKVRRPHAACSRACACAHMWPPRFRLPPSACVAAVTWAMH